MTFRHGIHSETEIRNGLRRCMHLSLGAGSVSMQFCRMHSFLLMENTFSGNNAISLFTEYRIHPSLELRRKPASSNESPPKNESSEVILSRFQVGFCLHVYFLLSAWTSMNVLRIFCSRQQLYCSGPVFAAGTSENSAAAAAAA